MIIRKLEAYEIKEAISLVWKTFLEYEKPDCTEEGVQTFYNCITTPSYIAMLVFYGAFEENELLGIIATRNGGKHIAMFFVADAYHRQGIGRKLFEEVLKDCTADRITVSSSPYAVPVYHKLGFVDTGLERITDGMRYTPMGYIREAERKDGASALPCTGNYAKNGGNQNGNAKACPHRLFRNLQASGKQCARIFAPARKILQIGYFSRISVTVLKQLFHFRRIKTGRS